jgi:hypothetical protein
MKVISQSGKETKYEDIIAGEKVYFTWNDIRNHDDDSGLMSWRWGKYGITIKYKPGKDMMRLLKQNCKETIERIKANEKNKEQAPHGQSLG